MVHLRHWATVLALATAGYASVAAAQSDKVTVEAGWVRATVVGQKATGAFMRLTASEPTHLVRVESPQAGVAEIHEMKMEKDVMKMRSIPALELPAGKAVELRPGGYHIMLMDLKQPLPKDSTANITLFFRDAQGAETSVPLTLPVGLQKPSAAAGGATPSPQHSGHSAHAAH